VKALLLEMAVFYLEKQVEVFVNFVYISANSVYSPDSDEML